MKKKLNLVYFSPTGGTKKAVCDFAENFTEFDSVHFDNTLPEKRRNELNFTAEDLVVVANPVYAGQMPQVKNLWSNLKGDNTPCVLLACYGNRDYEDTLAQMQEILQKQGFVVIAAAAVIIPHIFSEKLGAARPDEEDKKVLAELAALVQEKLQNGNIQAIKLPGNPAPEIKDPIPVPKTYAASQCTMCGACIALCPAEALSAENMEGDSSLCISCMRCVKYCRANARAFAGVQVTQWLESNFLSPRKVEIFN